MNEAQGKKRILIFSFAYHPVIGGAEVAVKEITDRINDIEFEMVTLRFNNADKPEEKIGNVKIHRIKSTKTTFPIDAYLYTKKLHEQKPYDCIWAIMAARAGGAAMFFKYSFPNVPYILTLQEGDPVWYMKLRSLYYINPFFRKIFSRADKVQAISNYLSDYAHAMGYAGKVEVIPNGVDVEKFSISNSAKNRSEVRKELGFVDEDVVLVTTGRLVTKNRVGDIVEALKFLPESVKFLIVGEGKLESNLKDAAKNLGVDRRVKFTGFANYQDIPEYLHASDIFIRPSISEGFGNSFIEAMAACLPVIATPVGGIVDFLFDPNDSARPTGLFARVRDPQSISRQVKRLMEDENLKEKIVENASKLVKEKYEWDLVAKRMKEEVFDTV